MVKRFYLLTRDLHLYLGLFISPFVVMFAISVFFLVHAWVPGGEPPQPDIFVPGVEVPSTVDQLVGRAQVAAIRPLLNQLGAQGEVSSIRRLPKEHRVSVKVILPGLETNVDVNTETDTATVSRRKTGFADTVIYLHKMPGPHNANLRANSFFMRVWKWLADATVYLTLFLSLSGIYLWAVLRAERRIGLILLAAGAISFFGAAYAISH